MQTENLTPLPVQKVSASKNILSAPPGYGAEITGAWLENALPLDGAIIKAAPEVMKIVDQLFPEILAAISADEKIKNTRTAKSKSRIKYSCKTILFNLFLAYLMDVPVRYSRDKTYYIKARRYGKLFFKYKRIIATVDAFKALDLIHQKKWINDREKGFRRQSRMWASEKLIAMFREATLDQPQQVYADEPKERVVLRNEMKISIDYHDTNQTDSIRKNIDCYNDFIAGQQVEVLSDETQKISLYNLNTKLFHNILKGGATLTNLQIDITGTHHQEKGSDNSSINKSSVNYYNIREEYNKNRRSHSTSMTQSFFQLPGISNASQATERNKPHDWFMTRVAPLMPVRDPQGDGMDLILDTMIPSRPISLATNRDTTTELSLLSTIVREKVLKHKKDKKFMKRKMFLRDFNISQVSFVINSKKLHRVFNRKSFELGGRFYGAFHQTMPKEFRKDILINGEQTIELDYAAHHIRIPYHLEKIDYREDPYMVLTDNEKERSIFKNLLLAAINAETEQIAIKGFRNKYIATAKKDRVSLTNENIRKLLARIHKEHYRIAGYINSGLGRELQFIDSQITEAILMRMTQQGIPCLPVHDSYIVPKKCEGQLKDAMEEEYQQIIGFLPIIG